MKISNNMSAAGFRCHLRIHRLVAISLLVGALLYRRYFFDLLGCFAFVFVAHLRFVRSRGNFLTEVYDCGSHLRLRLDNKELLVKFHEVERFEIRDGRDGLDWIAVYLSADTGFGRLIQFYPDMVRVPLARLDDWVVGFNKRITASRSAQQA